MPDARLLTWTPERVDQLQALVVDEGLPFAEIGQRIGLTKNQCLSKANRMGFKPRDGAPLSRMQKLSRESAWREPTTTADRLDALNPFPPSRGCVFPSGAPGEPGFSFCGETVAIPGVPYCPDHTRRCYLPAASKNLTIRKVGVQPAGRA